jgi:hypothetical protein
MKSLEHEEGQAIRIIGKKKKKTKDKRKSHDSWTRKTKNMVGYHFRYYNFISQTVVFYRKKAIGIWNGASLSVTIPLFLLLSLNHSMISQIFQRQNA